MGYSLYIFILGSFNITYNFAFTYSSTLIYNLFFIPFFTQKKNYWFYTINLLLLLLLFLKKQSLAFEAPVIVA